MYFYGVKNDKSVNFPFKGGKLPNKNITKRVQNNYQFVRNLFKCVIIILPKEMNQHIAKGDESI